MPRLLRVRDFRFIPVLYFLSSGGPQLIFATATRAEKRSIVECLLLAFPGLKLNSKNNQLQTTCYDGQLLIEFRDILSELRNLKESGKEGFNELV